MKNDIVTLEITDITPEGFGVGRVDGKVFFVADTAVGDKAEVLVLKELKKHSFGKVHKLLSPAESRIEPDCAVSSKCGGCVFRHIDYDFEREWKRNLVSNAFSRIGGMNIKVNDTVYGNCERYRNKVQYPIAPDEKGQCIFGYYARHSHRIVKHKTCPLQEEIFTEIAEFTVDYANKIGISPYNEIQGNGILRHIVMRKNREGGILVCLVARKKDHKLNSLAKALSEKFPRIEGIHLNLNKQKDNVIFGEETYCLLGKETLRDTLCGKIFELSPRAFYQVNAPMAEKLYEKAKELSKTEKNGKIILDLYCGAGTIGLSVAQDNDKLCGVEIIDAAIENAKKNARLNGRSRDNTLFVCGDASVGVEECRDKFGNPEIIIVDPPRKGLERKVIETVAAARPEKIVYISCDPATLARDCAFFAELGYFTNEATPFDLFPRTGHIETVALLSRQIDVHKMRLNSAPFEMIKCGEKTIELRLFDEKRQQVKTGDKIVFTNNANGEILNTTVVKLHRFDSFKELYKSLPLLKCGYTTENVDNAKPSDMEQYYSVEEQRKYGVVGIELCQPKQITDETIICLSK